MPFRPQAQESIAAKLPVVPYEHCAAKKTDDGRPGTTVFEHCRNVGYVARELAELLPESLRELLAVNPALPVSMHDVGKVSPGFELKYFADSVVKQYAPDLVGQTGFSRHHAAISAAAVDRFLGARKMTLPVSIAVAAHHGAADRSYAPDTSEICGGPSWAEERRKLIEVLTAQFGGKLSDAAHAHPALLAGLTCVADWIGSDEEFFPADGAPRWNGDPQATARHAVSFCGFGSSPLRRGLSFRDVFGFSPHAAQREFIENIRKPGVYVLEAPMGLGKTEAALYAVYRLMEAGCHHGFYFALPTRLTSDRIHERVTAFLGRITDASRTPRLAHGMAWLKPFAHGGEHFEPGASWFNPMKRALLYPYAVGTIDQALMGVLNVRHGFVRLFGLAGKAVILDEVHSYDLYTGTLLDELVRRLQSIGCTVIILSATLTGKRREQIVGGSDRVAPPDDYPLMTGLPMNEPPFTTALPAPAGNVCGVRFEAWDVARVAREAAAAARAGTCTVCIANTVAKAQAWYKALISERHEGEFEVGILHARFPLVRREQIETDWMKALGKGDADRPSGCVLIATQVLEQSVDIDADWMISELAPSDMLLQRMGRLWRHSRPRRPRERAELVVVTQDPSGCETVEDVVQALGKENCCVYAPYVLLRTYAAWTSVQRVTLPSDIRPLIEATYADVSASETGLMCELRQQLERRSEKLRRLACGAQDTVRGIPTGVDDEHAATRYSDLPSRTVLLLAAAEEKTGWSDQARVQLLDGTRLELDRRRSDFSVTKTLHANIVSVASHLLPERGDVGQACNWLERHFFDKPVVLILDAGGRLSCFKGPETTLCYSKDYGISRYDPSAAAACAETAPETEDATFAPFINDW